MLTKEEVLAEIRKIRQAHPNKPVGKHWELYGCYIGDDVWGDPDYFGLPSEAVLGFD